MDTLDIPGAPNHELTRSPAALAVGRLARTSGLFMAHFEHRVQLELPEAWVPEGRPDLGVSEGWRGGVLPESKYHAFRHDLLVGSFNPPHRAKWTAHELCHGLVGFAWRPGAPLLFHALAARLAEALPVALWYFFDEAGLARCRDHAGQGPLWGDFCADCEAAASDGAVGDASDPRWIVEGRAFLQRELTAVTRSRRLGRPISHRLATLDLASDGLAYAAAHAGRLASPEMERFVAQFFPPGAGHHDSLDALEARVLEVTEAILSGAPCAPLATTPARLAAQDVAWRLLTILAQAEGEAADGLDALVDALAAAPTETGLVAAMRGYDALHADYELPEPDDVFAVGYALPGGAGRSARQVAEGIASALPGTWARLGRAADEVAATFTAQDAFVRQPLGRRFAGWLGARGADPEADVARWEAALVHAAPVDLVARTLGSADARGDAWRLAGGLELVRSPWDLGALSEAPTARPRPGPSSFLVGREASGEVLVAELSEAAADAVASLSSGPASDAELDARGLGADERQHLRELGLLVPLAWREA